MVLSLIAWSLSAGNVAAGAAENADPSPAQRLLLIGGGDTPPAALARYMDWAGGKDSKILLVTWASLEAEASYKAHAAEMSRYRPGAILWAKSPPENPAEKSEFLSVLSQATAVFFGGGDQNRIFKVLEDSSILQALQSRYQVGVPFAGTSAGTAIMSLISIAGGSPEVIDGSIVPTGRGLGLLPGTILDMHFMRRQRENRLFGLILQYPDLLGIGVDESTSIAVENGRCGEVIGPGDVMMVDALRIPGSLAVTLLRPGQRVNLVTRTRADQGCI